MKDGAFAVLSAVQLLPPFTPGHCNANVARHMHICYVDRTYSRRSPALVMQAFRLKLTRKVTRVEEMVVRHSVTEHGGSPMQCRVICTMKLLVVTDAVHPEHVIHRNTVVKKLARR